MFKKYGVYAGIVLILIVVAIFMFSSTGDRETESTSEVEASPEMIAEVEELEAGIRRLKEEEGEAAACEAVEQAEQMIFMATEVAWLHRNPGPELRPVYQKAVADGTPMTELFDFETGEALIPERYREWDEHDRGTATLKATMADSVRGQQCVDNLEAICAISETNPHGFALVKRTLAGLSGEMSCGD